ncbi:unnamed protein product [Orchesella dallaii]
MSGNITSSGRIGRSGMGRLNGNNDRIPSSSSHSRFFSNRDSSSSMSFSEVNLSMSSIHEDAEGRTESEVICDKDVWATRIILSALEDLTFEETPFPKLTTRFIQAIQIFLFSVNNTTSNYNPFVEFTKPNNSSLDYSEVEDVSYVQNNAGHQPEVSREIMETLSSVSPEIKVLVRTLVSSYVRHSASQLVEMWKPVLDSNGVVTTQQPVSNSKASGLVHTGGESDLKATLKAVLDLLLNLQKQCKDLDTGVRDRLKQRDESVMKLARDLKEFKEIAVEVVKEKSAQNDPEFVTQCMNYMQLETLCLKEQSRLENLNKEAEENPEKLQKESNEVYKTVNELYSEMLSKTNEDEQQ